MKTTEIELSDLAAVRARRLFLARVVRARASELPENSDLWESVTKEDGEVKMTVADKLAAIAEDTRLARSSGRMGVEDWNG